MSVQLSATDYRTGAYLDQGSSQTYRVATASGSTISINVQGDADGLTGNEIVNQLNAGLSATGSDGVSVERRWFAPDFGLRTPSQ